MLDLKFDLRWLQNFFDSLDQKTDSSSGFIVIMLFACGLFLIFRNMTHQHTNDEISYMRGMIEKKQTLKQATIGILIFIALLIWFIYNES